MKVRKEGLFSFILGAVVATEWVFDTEGAKLTDGTKETEDMVMTTMLNHIAARLGLELVAIKKPAPDPQPAAPVAVQAVPLTTTAQGNT